MATVHWRSERWIDIQVRNLRRFLPGEPRLYAFLNRVPGDHRHKFAFVSEQPIKDHATKLSLLGDVMCFAAADPSDLLVFADGDAFPVAPLGPLLEERLERHRLIAVQRTENNGDLQPHPCFCVTTVGFWQEIGGEWYSGYRWDDAQGRSVTDVGGNLLGHLREAGVDWYPLRRVNTVDLHPLFFALYGDEEHGPLVYHHGGAFRSSKGGRVNRVLAGEPEAWRKLRSRLLERVPRSLRWLRRRYSPARRLRRSLRLETRELSEQVLAELERDEEFWRRFVSEPRAGARG